MNGMRLRSFETPTGFRILYLARHVKPPVRKIDQTAGQYPRYHNEIATLLGTFGAELTVSGDASAVLREGPGVDYIFSLFNRVRIRHGEVFVSAVCEYLRKPYLGSSPAIRALAEDKHLAKLVVESLGFDTPEWTLFDPVLGGVVSAPFRGPYFVKPRMGAGSEWITEDSLQETWKGARNRAEEMIAEGIDALIEKFIHGENVTQPVLGDLEPIVLPPILCPSSSRGRILTRDIKLQSDHDMDYQEVSNSETSRRLRSLAQRLYREIQPVDYLRIDFRYESETNCLWFLEFNICCDISSFGSFMAAAQRAGLSQQSVLSHILAFSVERQKSLRQHLQGVL